MLGLVADHAYWVSEVAVAEAGTADAPGKGVVDAFSHGFGQGAPPSEQGGDAGVGPLPYTEVNRSWGEAPAIDVANHLDVDLENVTSARVALRRAALDPTKELTLSVTADRAGTLLLDGAFPAGSAVERDGEVLEGASAGPDGASVPVAEGEQEVRIFLAADDTTPGDAQPTAQPVAAPPTVTPAASLPATGGSLAIALGMLGVGALLRRRMAR